ncbi:MAG: DUF5320 domain-containing protein [Deltaproteobacteria bacterium]|nr:MAG: DUF5320 domain-containing protein [Deltaproteobacteria bacterium]
MPGFDRRGPEGMGPTTGWGRGRCTPYGRQAGRGGFGSQSGRGGRGGGWRHRFSATGFPGWGRGWFRGPNFAPSYASEDEMAVLKEEAAWLKEELQSIEQRLSELEAEASQTDQ